VLHAKRLIWTRPGEREAPLEAVFATFVRVKHKPGLAAASIGPVRREFSAGGVVVRNLRGGWRLAAIRPAGKDDVWALPKGLIGGDESAADTALREVAEETGVDAELIEKLGDVRYVYTWKGERVFKVVSFFLMRYRRGRLGDLLPALAHEVAEARWLLLEDAPRLLAYKGEREMAAKTLQILEDRRL
jgi:8-oxo-dGTP pyrophosphatase MutT (NUDIX family)